MGTHDGPDDHELKTFIHARPPRLRNPEEAGSNKSLRLRTTSQKPVNVTGRSEPIGAVMSHELHQEIEALKIRFDGIEKIKQGKPGPQGPYGHKGDKGDKGDTGETGVGIPGPALDITEVVAESKKIVTEAIARIQHDLRSAIVSELTTRGVIDANGNAIPGPAGKDGADSTVAGPAGKDGESIVGPAGRNGVDGQSITGPAGKDGKDADISAAVAAVTAAVETKLASFVSGLEDLIVAILTRTNVLDADGNKVPAPAGPQGVPGVQGKPGNIAAALSNCEQYVQQEMAKFRIELGLK